MRRVTLLLTFALSTAAAAQDLSKAKQLYAAAAYEEALAILDAGPAGDGIEPAEYRVLCLLALNRMDDAEGAIEGLLRVQPGYRPELSLMSPRARTLFEERRGSIITRRYAEAKASFDGSDYRTAAVRFDRITELLAGEQDNPELAELKILAGGFRELAKAMSAGRSAAAPPATRAPAPRAGDQAWAPQAAPDTRFQGPVDGIYDSSAGTVVPPVPLKPILPPIAPELVTPVPSPGLFEIVIDEKGRVESMVVRQSINASYDKLVLEESRGWRYRPATHDGKPVKFRKVIEIYSSALQSMKRP